MLGPAAYFAYAQTRSLRRIDRLYVLFRFKARAYEKVQTREIMNGKTSYTEL
jgi:hypothetical protein